MNIVEMQLSELKPYENNPRYNDEAATYVAESIDRFGFKIPIIVDKDYVIIAGHTRYKAAHILGLVTVPCIIADDLDEKQVKAYRIADNRMAELSEWNFDKYNEEVKKCLIVVCLTILSYLTFSVKRRTSVLICSTWVR